MIKVASISKTAPDGEGTPRTLPCAPSGARKDSPAPPPQILLGPKDEIFYVCISPNAQ